MNPTDKPSSLRSISLSSASLPSWNIRWVRRTSSAVRANRRAIIYWEAEKSVPMNVTSSSLSSTTFAAITGAMVTTILPRPVAVRQRSGYGKFASTMRTTPSWRRRVIVIVISCKTTIAVGDSRGTRVLESSATGDQRFDLSMRLICLLFRMELLFFFHGYPFLLERSGVPGIF